MKSAHWEIIQKNFILLVQEVDSKYIVPPLFEDGILSIEDKAKINASCSGMETLLKILKDKPLSLNPYEGLIKALTADNLYNHVAEHLKNTITTSDPNLVTKGDPNEHKDLVRKILLEYYTNQPGRTKLSDIMQTVQKNVNVPGGLQWKNDQLSEFVCEIFGGAQVVKERRSMGGKKKNFFILNVIPLVKEKRSTTGAVGTLLSDDNQISVHEDNLKTSDITHTADIPIKEVAKFNPSELKKYLAEFFSQKELKTDLPDIFEEQQISGEVFMNMTEPDVKSVYPKLPFGVLKTLSALISELNGKTTAARDLENREQFEKARMLSIKTEKLREFNSDVSDTDSYVEGREVLLKISSIRRKLDPVKSFHLVPGLDSEETKDFSLEEMASKAIEFISACANERQNGTIYFGIDPDINKIVGLAVNKEEVETCLKYYMDLAFPEEPLKSNINKIWQPFFIPMIDSFFENISKYVIEIDVAPSNCCLKGVIKTKLKHLTHFSRADKKIRKYGHFCFDEITRVPKLLEYHKLEEFSDHVKLSVDLRQAEEDNVFSNTPENLRKKLLNLLTGGRDKLEDAIYPFLILSPLDPKMDENFINNNMQFIKCLQTDVIFDFDPTGSSNGIYHHYDKKKGEIMTVLTLDNFVAPENSKDFKSMISDLDSDKIPWVFCNGYEPTSAKTRIPTEWNKQIRSAFQQALKHFTKSRSKDRIIVILCLFSKNYETMLEGCEEILTNFPDQWVVYAESESVSEMWKSEMIQRKKVDEKDAFERLVVGLTWEQINSTIIDVTQQTETNGCILPQAAGTFTKQIPEKKLKYWYDVEVVSAADPDVDDDRSKQVMESFYKGESVDWLNFWFEDQVLRRSHHVPLLEMVKKALVEGDKEENKVSTVVVFHHPGSGATTSAKQVLWELRKEYRCCVIKNITEETCNQLLEVRKYSEPSKTPKPILILVDNEDPEKYHQLKQSLEKKSRDHCKENNEAFKVFCTMLVCIRKASLPLQVLSHQIKLEQKLTKQEQKLFGKKHKQLTSDFEANKDSIDPKYLISFYILKNNFSPEYISKVIKDFVGDVNDDRELSLLAYIALLNKYDPHFRPVPVSCFDATFRFQFPIKRQATVEALKRSTNWEANLSQAVQVLLNMSPLKKSGTNDARISLRVHHKLIADNLLEYLKNCRGNLDEIMLRLINSVVFEHGTEDFITLENIVGDILKKREFNQEDGKREMFSPFITQVNKVVGEQVSLKILCELFEKSNDPFTAQQISRFYYSLSNWEKAEIYAQKAIDIKPKCSYLWDTYGQVYKTQLIERMKFAKTADKNKKFDNVFVHHVISLAQKAIDCFKNEQRLSEMSSSFHENSVAGYFGELKTQILLLRLLERCQCFKTRSDLSKCLMDKDFSDLKFLKPEEITFLTHLEENSMQTVRVLDEQYLQVREDPQFDVALYSGTFGREMQNLVSLMLSFHDYFGTLNDYTYIDTLPAPIASMHRWRVALKHGAMSLNLLLQYRTMQANQGEKQLTKNLLIIYKMMLPNVLSNESNFEYLVAILNGVIMLVIDGLVEECAGLTYEKVLEWSNNLYDCKPTDCKRPYLEPYMYFVMFHFPSPNREGYNICPVKKLQDVCDSWKKTYEQKFMNSEAKTLFYLAKGDLLMDLVHSDTLPMKAKDNWENPKIRSYLALYSGTVEMGGRRVNINIARDGNTYNLQIPTSYTVKKDLWQKETHFFIGFSFAGPKAYGIPQDPPEIEAKKPSELWKTRAAPSKGSSSPSIRTNNGFQYQSVYDCSSSHLSYILSLRTQLDGSKSGGRDMLEQKWYGQVDIVLNDID